MQTFTSIYTHLKDEHADLPERPRPPLPVIRPLQNKFYANEAELFMELYGNLMLGEILVATNSKLHESGKNPITMEDLKCYYGISILASCNKECY